MRTAILIIIAGLSGGVLGSLYQLKGEEICRWFYKKTGYHLTEAELEFLLLCAGASIGLGLRQFKK